MEQQEPRTVGLLAMCAMGVAIGLATGLGAVGVGSLVGFFHNLFFYGEISTFYNDEELIDISPFGPLIILAPIIGGLGVVFITRTFGPEARGNGVPEVMDAIYHRGGRMRPRIALVKAIASSLSIGSGASVGREGPMVQIGAAVGSAFGQFANLASWQRVTLLAAGAGAALEDEPLLLVPVEDRVHGVVDREDEAGRDLLRQRDQGT